MSYEELILYLREQSRKNSSYRNPSYEQNSPWENSLWEPIWDHEMPKYSDSPKIPRSKPIIICGAQGNNRHDQNEQSFFDIVWDVWDDLN